MLGHRKDGEICPSKQCVGVEIIKWPYGTCNQLLKQQHESREISLSRQKETNMASHLKSGSCQLSLSSFVFTDTNSVVEIKWMPDTQKTQSIVFFPFRTEFPIYEYYPRIWLLAFFLFEFSIFYFANIFVSFYYFQIIQGEMNSESQICLCIYSLVALLNDFWRGESWKS